MVQKLQYFTYDVTHKKSATPNKKKIFRVQTRRLADLLEPLNSSSAIGGEDMALVRQLLTAGFRTISKYEYIVPWLSKCYWLSHTVKIVTGDLTRDFITLYYSNPKSYFVL